MVGLHSVRANIPASLELVVRGSHRVVMNAQRTKLGARPVHGQCAVCVNVQAPCTPCTKSSCMLITQCRRDLASEGRNGVHTRSLLCPAALSSVELSSYTGHSISASTRAFTSASRPRMDSPIGSPVEKKTLSCSHAWVCFAVNCESEAPESNLPHAVALWRRRSYRETRYGAPSGRSKNLLQRADKVLLSYPSVQDRFPVGEAQARPARASPYEDVQAFCHARQKTLSSIWRGRLTKLLGLSHNVRILSSLIGILRSRRQHVSSSCAHPSRRIGVHILEVRGLTHLQKSPRNVACSGRHARVSRLYCEASRRAIRECDQSARSRGVVRQACTWNPRGPQKKLAIILTRSRRLQLQDFE
ncbi:hypothetical protein L226DRAFT_313549 [Lentinus tigrinus ALCF2SS1-7]|uniref:uncharacterized protein n=1 Tax=Lentinus tigrinus ALCF2SS1-7 TaxID=1328758 RepID=UPI001165F68C|nr:hypothetical protein L226DRAFT_313549 [Lentinus tigrinus ALCF2SS1-7]